MLRGLSNVRHRCNISFWIRLTNELTTRLRVGPSPSRTSLSSRSSKFSMGDERVQVHLPTHQSRVPTGYQRDTNIFALELVHWIPRNSISKSIDTFRVTELYNTISIYTSKVSRYGIIPRLGDVESPKPSE